MSGYEAPFRNGSLSFRLRTADERDSAALSEMFKAPLGPDAARGERETATRGRVEFVPGTSDFPPVPPDGLIVSRANGTFCVSSELIRGTLHQRSDSWRACIEVHDRGTSDLVYRTHLSVVFHRLLLALGRAYVHAAAVTHHDRTFVFVGEKGAGKSSIATSLGRGGATILSDDHVLLTAGMPKYFVSGCEPWARVTADTEAAVFASPLPVTAEDFAGTLKKEFRVGDFFASRPHEDVPIAAVLFPRVGTRVDLRRRSARSAALDLIQRTRRSYRPQDASDVQALLDFWLGLVRTAAAFDLELSPHVEDLATLGDRLDACAPQS
jgi:hypothetical protein